MVEGNRIVELKSVEKVPSGSSETGPHLPPPNRNETCILAQLRRSPDEGWHHANRPRRVMRPSPWLRGVVRRRSERKRRRTGAGDPDVRRWQGHSRWPNDRDRYANDILPRMTLLAIFGSIKLPNMQRLRTCFEPLLSSSSRVLFSLFTP